MSEEIWRAIPTWEGVYEVCNQGMVRSLDRMSNKGTGRSFYRGKVLLAPPGKNGYRKVGLSEPGRKEWHYLHSLVAESFLGPCPDGHEVCHRSGDRLDCREGNLRYGTHKSNMFDRHAHGTMPKNKGQFKGERNGNHKLTEPDVHRIRSAVGVTNLTLADEYGVVPSCIARARNGDTWTHLK